ncbi:MAG: DUF368 domain-containing protein [Clostridiaceae bacterium]|nr:DUF368 domain-containing protein [Clostridiaceae bacterium]
MKDLIVTAAKGAVIGGTMLIPGVSGGSMAMMMGIYDKLIMAVSNFRKDVRRHFLFLLWFCIGAGLGMLIIARPLLHLLEVFPFPTQFFFIGAVAGCVPMIYNKARLAGFSWHVPVYILIGMAVVALLGLLPSDLVGGELGVWEPLLLLVAGVVCAAALVLPGISVSYLLLMLGLYDKTMAAISGLDILFLLPLFIGLCAGIVLTTKLLDSLMTNRPRATYLIILGFMIASVLEVFPGVPPFSQWIACILCLAAGFSVIYFISRKE